jgi:hypothetical protein
MTGSFLIHTCQSCCVSACRSCCVSANASAMRAARAHAPTHPSVRCVHPSAHKVFVCVGGGGVACVRALGYSYFSKPLLLATTAPPTRGQATAACFNACCRFVYTYTHEQIVFQDKVFGVLVFSIQGLSNYSQKKACRFLYVYTRKHCLCTHVRTHAQTSVRAHTHTQTHKHTLSHEHTHARTHTHAGNFRVYDWGGNFRVYDWGSGVWGLEFSLGFRQRLPPRQCRARKQDRTFLPVLLIL